MEQWNNNLRIMSAKHYASPARLQAHTWLFIYRL